MKMMGTLQISEGSHWLLSLVLKFYPPQKSCIVKFQICLGVLVDKFLLWIVPRNWKTLRAMDYSSLRVSWCQGFYWYRYARELQHSTNSEWYVYSDSRHCRVAKHGEFICVGPIWGGAKLGLWLGIQKKWPYKLIFRACGKEVEGATWQD